jgi:hypothetical protein
LQDEVEACHLFPSTGVLWKHQDVSRGGTGGIGRLVIGVMDDLLLSLLTGSAPGLGGGEVGEDLWSRGSRRLHRRPIQEEVSTTARQFSGGLP